MTTRINAEQFVAFFNVPLAPSLALIAAVARGAYWSFTCIQGTLFDVEVATHDPEVACHLRTSGFVEAAEAGGGAVLRWTDLLTPGERQP